MSIHEQALEANAAYASRFDKSDLPIPPAKKLAVVACMDARLTIEPMLGLETGDAHIIRNAGGIVTEDEIRSLIISNKLLGTETVFVINHTDCGMLSFEDEQLRQKLKEETGHDTELEFHAFKDLDTNVREQVRKIKDNPFLGEKVAVHGFVFDVKTGKLNEVN